MAEPPLEDGRGSSITISTTPIIDDSSSDIISTGRKPPVDMVAILHQGAWDKAQSLKDESGGK